MTSTTEAVSGPMRNPPHPGRALKGDLDALGLSVVEAAQALKISRSQLHRVLGGQSALSAELALKLEVVVGSTAEAWLHLQVAYDAAVARRRAGEITRGLRRISPPSPAAEQPVSV